MPSYMSFIADRVSQYGKQFSAANLIPKYTPYFERGYTVKVRLADNTIREGVITVIGDVRPGYALTSGPSSLNFILSADCEIIKE